MAKATVLRPIGRADRVDGQEVRNELLLHLPENERELIHAQLTFMTLSTHAILNEAEGEIEDTYFMNSGLASVLNVMKDGKSVEVGLTGKEGFVGLPVNCGFQIQPFQSDRAGIRVSVPLEYARSFESFAQVQRASAETAPLFSSPLGTKLTSGGVQPLA
jgi:hypothetical protein